jgi:hypothetical protein
MAEKRLLGLNRRLHKNDLLRRRQEDQRPRYFHSFSYVGSGGSREEGRGKKGGARAWKGKEKPASHMNLERR